MKVHNSVNNEHQVNQQWWFLTGHSLQQQRRKITSVNNKWRHFQRHWPFVWGIQRSPVNYPHKGQWRGALVFPLICTWTNSWANIGDACDLRRNRIHYDVINCNEVWYKQGNIRQVCRVVKLPWISPGDPLTFNGTTPLRRRWYHNQN